MSLFWVVLITFVSVVAGTGLCFWLLYHVRDVDASTWILEHIGCPIIRILVLLIIVSQIYPVTSSDPASFEFWRILGQQNQFNDLINILFIGGLLLSFLPVVSHPVFALPLQTMLTIALVFHWQYSAAVENLILFPSWLTLGKILIYMSLAYFVTREASTRLSHQVDRRFHIEGSIRLISDAIYLSLQVPVILIYCGFLRQQIPAV